MGQPSFKATNRCSPKLRTPMVDEHNVGAVSRFDGDAYKSSQAAELILNAAILRAEIAGSYEEFLETFETFYADDGEVSSEDSRESIHGKEIVRTHLSFPCIDSRESS